MKKRNNLKFGILLFAFLLPATLFPQNAGKIKTVVIDAGHGGSDPGGVNKAINAKEKDVALAVALATGALIKKNHPDVNVIYTRETDIFVELETRANIANQHKADLFISIHCNAVEDKRAYGTETWVLGKSDKADAANLNVLKRENDVIKQEKDASQYSNFLNSPEAVYLLKTFQQYYHKNSMDMAANVQKQLLKRTGSKDRQVNAAGFLVLWKTKMASVLIELGFITNDKEGKYLASKDGQNEMAQAIAQAFSDYKKAYEANNAIASGDHTAPVVETPVAEADPEVETPAETPTAQIDDTPAATQNVKPANNTKPKPDPKPTPKKVQPKVSYKVQFFISDRKLAAKDKRIAKIKEVDYYELKGSYCYTSGDFQDKDKAFARQREVQKQGYPDAWVVCFVDGKRVSMKEADRVLQEIKGGN